MVRTLATLLLLHVATASAEIYRCDRNGKLEFSDRACAAGQAPMQVLAPNVLETSSGDRLLAQAFDAETASLRARRVAAEKARARALAAAEKPKAAKSRPVKEKKHRATKQPKAGKQTPVEPRRIESPKRSKPRR